MHVLLMYVHEYSGHHCAALALQRALGRLDPTGEHRLVDALRYTHPLLERLIRRTYMEIIKKKPEVWEYLYDNAAVVRHAQTLRNAIHRSHSLKFKKLIETFVPEAVVCTQAFPCGIVSDYKATFSWNVPLYGVLTDFLPHSYWVLGHADKYFVPTQEAADMLHENGVFSENIVLTGIPVENAVTHEFSTPAEKKPPAILLMGGSQGLGPIEKIMRTLDSLPLEFDLHVATGRNKRLFLRLTKKASSFGRKVFIYPYLENINGLMQKATLLVSKPGGLTMAQALACQVPVIFISPIPGQEAKNASILLKHRAAVEAKTEEEVALFAGELLRQKAKVELMKRNMKKLAHPDAAECIGRLVLEPGTRN